MKNMGIVQGSGEQAKKLIVGKDTVYVHTNIKPITEDSNGNLVENLFEYNEVQYDKDEFIKLMSDQSDEIQLALVELYESLEV